MVSLASRASPAARRPAVKAAPDCNYDLECAWRAAQRPWALTAGRRGLSVRPANEIGSLSIAGKRTQPQTVRSIPDL